MAATLSPTADEIFEKVVATATKLIATDLVNSVEDSRYQDQEKDPKDKQLYNILRYDLAVEDAAAIVTLSMTKTNEILEEVEALEQEALDREIDEDGAVTKNYSREAGQVEMMGPPGGHKSGVRGSECASRKSNSKTSANSKRSKKRSARG